MTPEKRQPTTYERISNRRSFYEARPAEVLRLFLDPAICVFCDHPLAAHEGEAGRCTVNVLGPHWKCICSRQLHFAPIDLGDGEPAYDPPTHTVVPGESYLWVTPGYELSGEPTDPRVLAWRDLAACRPEGMPIHHYIQALKRSLGEAAEAIADAARELRKNPR